MCDTSPDTSQDALNVKMLMLLIRSLPYVDTNPDLHRIGGDELREEISSFLKGLKPMYTNGELEEVMKSFEKTLKVAPVYAGGGTDRADADGRLSLTDGLDAGSVAASAKRYRITYLHDHKTLRIGDVVVMTESPQLDNLLLRVPDMTLHRLRDDNEQYVHMIAEKLSELNAGLGIADKLRQKTCGEISCEQCNDDREAAASAIELLYKHIRY